MGVHRVVVPVSRLCQPRDQGGLTSAGSRPATSLRPGRRPPTASLPSALTFTSGLAHR
jgi:hypothetical protein